MLFNLKMALQRKHRTLYLAARHLGLSETRLSRIIAQRAEPTPDERRRLASDLAGLSVPEQTLFVGEETS